MEKSLQLKLMDIIIDNCEHDLSANDIQGVILDMIDPGSSIRNAMTNLYDNDKEYQDYYYQIERKLDSLYAPSDDMQIRIDNGILIDGAILLYVLSEALGFDYSSSNGSNSPDDLFSKEIQNEYVYERLWDHTPVRDSVRSKDYF